jgi:hypothetical protein
MRWLIIGFVFATTVFAEDACIRPQATHGLPEQTTLTDDIIDYQNLPEDEQRLWRLRVRFSHLDRMIRGLWESSDARKFSAIEREDRVIRLQGMLNSFIGQKDMDEDLRHLYGHHMSKYVTELTESVKQEGWTEATYSKAFIVQTQWVDFIDLWGACR